MPAWSCLRLKNVKSSSSKISGANDGRKQLTNGARRRRNRLRNWQTHRNKTIAGVLQNLQPKQTNRELRTFLQLKIYALQKFFQRFSCFFNKIQKWNQGRVFFLYFRIWTTFWQITPAGLSTNKLFTLISLKMAKHSEAKSAKRSVASKYLEIIFWREASLRALSLPTPFHSLRNLSGQLIGRFTRRG